MESVWGKNSNEKKAIPQQSNSGTLTESVLKKRIRKQGRKQAETATKKNAPRRRLKKQVDFIQGKGWRKGIKESSR